MTELMVVLAIIGLFTLLAPTMFTHTIRFWYLHTAKVEIQRDARAAFSNINRFLRQATYTSITIDNAAGQPPCSRISFTTVQGQRYLFYQKNNSLYQVAQSTATLSTNLRYIAFTYPRSDDPTIISVSMTMEKATYQGGTKALELSVEKVRIMK